MDLAELKLSYSVLSHASLCVLIGPCGIETRAAGYRPGNFQRVLIGPCGIETLPKVQDPSLPSSVLIGPCGIETADCDRRSTGQHRINWTLRN